MNTGNTSAGSTSSQQASSVRAKRGKRISVAAITAILVASGYGGYTLVKEKDLAGMRAGGAALYKVERVIDGDTFELEDKEVVRLVGIDAPEEGECYYDESKEALRKLLEGKEVELRKDVTGTDDFGRLLRYAVLPSASALSDNILADEYMVKGGYAEPRSNPRDKLYYGLLLEEREQAVAAKRGIWGACDYTPTEHSQTSAKAPNAKCTIKGNISTGTFGKTYFLKECNNYEQVKIDPDRGEEYFCSEAEAVKAGFAKARYCP
ncbi:MAG: thermonuclease family protein [bacterium]|nr:thermonuclease family protein [bacterium]